MIKSSLKELEHEAYIDGNRELSSKLAEIVDNYTYWSEGEYTRGYHSGWDEGASSCEQGYYDTGYEVAMREVKEGLIKHLRQNDVSDRVLKLVGEVL